MLSIICFVESLLLLEFPECIFEVNTVLLRFGAGHDLGENFQAAVCGVAFFPLYKLAGRIAVRQRNI